MSKAISPSGLLVACYMYVTCCTDHLLQNRKVLRLPTCVDLIVLITIVGMLSFKLRNNGTVQAAPEVTNSGYYTTACDVWSLGILLYRMLFGEEPFASFREAADARFPVQFPEDAHQTVSQDAIDLISWMLKHDFHGRPSLQQVCSCRSRSSSSSDHQAVYRMLLEFMCCIMV